MKTLSRISLVAFVGALVLMLDLSPLPLVPDAEGQYGTRNRERRRTTRRTAVVVSSASSTQTQQAQQQAAASQQQAAEAEQRADAAEQDAAAARAEADAAQQQAAAAQAAAVVPPPATTPSGPMPVGTVVTALPPGCGAVNAGGVEYYRCGSDYYRAAFQGSQLVYVTTDPP